MECFPDFICPQHLLGKCLSCSKFRTVKKKSCEKRNPLGSSSYNSNVCNSCSFVCVCLWWLRFLLFWRRDILSLWPSCLSPCSAYIIWRFRGNDLQFRGIRVMIITSFYFGEINTFLCTSSCLSALMTKGMLTTVSTINVHWGKRRERIEQGAFTVGKFLNPGAKSNRLKPQISQLQ